MTKHSSATAFRPTLAEIARQAQVHHSTASCILNGAKSSTRVSAETRQRVLAVAARLGYQPNRAAQQLRTRRSQVIGLLVSDLENPFFARLVSLCIAELENVGYECVLAMRRSGEVSDLHLLRTLMSRQVDGLLVWSETDSEIRAWFKSMPIAPNVVVMGYRMAECDSVEAALHEGIAAAMNHLFDQGFRRIGYLAPAASLALTGDPRPGNYRHWMQQFGQEPLVYTYEGWADTPEAARLRAEEIAADRPSERPDALLCFNDMTAIGALQGLRRRGLRVPHDIGLVGCDDLPLVAQMDVPISSVAFPLQEICRIAVRLLLDRIEGSADTTEEPDAPSEGTALLPRYQAVPATLKIRESSLKTPYSP